MRKNILLLAAFLVSFLARGQNPVSRVTFSSGGSSNNTKPSSFGEPFASAKGNVTLGSQQNSDYRNLSTVSVAQIPKLAVFEIYPNPAQSVLNISLTGNGMATYTAMIYDGMGRRCITKENIMHSTNIDVATLPNGIYLFIAFNTNNEKVFEHKFFKN